ncbi:cellulose biosynthesis protein BcsQ [Xenophilus arseniciresistens]|uniref:Cellulose biosynthesis protein BcsQ n=1 Tax=Xenophilus arseniciresistens TaxID=1283306 RepID=A0AAE3SZA9_9BURK|nr:cellulose biosynthesis protein BcsQ [Xenophilus arseniciresistens]MDA7415671.1 cellulose biosynthesis protein BcsQ [Xenophilus arseniciresistens]
MQVLPVISAKGGVGKTTVAANLSTTLAELGRRVLAIDLDPQSALRLHLAPEPASQRGGLASVMRRERNWRDAMVHGRQGVLLLPFGDLDDDGLISLEQHLAGHPNWLGELLASFSLPDDTLVIVDTPPGPSVYLQQVLRLSRINIVPLLADAGSVAAAPLLEQRVARYCVPRADFIGNAYVLNQTDPGRRLNHDVQKLLRQKLGDEVLGTVHLDPAVSEALASALPVRQYAPWSQSAQDFADCAAHLLRRLAPVSAPASQAMRQR